MARFGNVAPSGARERVAAPVDAFGSGQEQIARGAGLQALGQGLGKLGAQLAAEEKVESVKRDRLALGEARLRADKRVQDLHATEATLKGSAAIGHAQRVEQGIAAIYAEEGEGLAENNAPAWQSAMSSSYLRGRASAQQRERRELDNGIRSTAQLEIEGAKERVAAVSAGTLLADSTSLDDFVLGNADDRGVAFGTVADLDGLNKNERAAKMKEFREAAASELATRIITDSEEMGFSDEDALATVKRLDQYTPTDKQEALLKRQIAQRQKNAENARVAGMTKEMGGLKNQADREALEAKWNTANPTASPFHKMLRKKFDVETSPTANFAAQQVVDNPRLTQDEKLDALNEMFRTEDVSGDDYLKLVDNIEKDLKTQAAETLQQLDDHLKLGLETLELDKTLGDTVNKQNSFIHTWARQMLRENPSMTFDQLKKELGDSLSGAADTKASITLKQAMKDHFTLSARAVFDPIGAFGDFRELQKKIRPRTHKERLTASLERASAASAKRSVDRTTQKGAPKGSAVDYSKLNTQQLLDAKKKLKGK